MLREEFFKNGTRLEVDSDTKIAVVTLDRPPVNPVNPDESVLRDTFQSFTDRKDVNCVILTGGGTKAFCAGANLKASRSQELTPSQMIDSGRGWREVKAAVRECRVPVIGAINGAATGAGVGLASSCDFLIASENARFSVNEVNVGLLGGGTALLRMGLNQFKLRALYFTADWLNAQDLYRLGVVEAVVPPDRLMPEAMKVAERIAQKSPVVLRMAKESLSRLEKFIVDWDEAYHIEQDHTHKLGFFEDSKEARASWVENRKPDWKWR